MRDYDLFLGNVITSRIRLARNLDGYPFFIKNQKSAKDVVKSVNRALVKCDTFNLYYMSNLSPIKMEALKEKYLISNSLIDNKECGAVLINTDETVSVMINEEDVIREQCFLKGLNLFACYDRLKYIDEELEKNLDLAYSKKFGYLTACPTNLGTGLRASVLMFLPALTEGGKISALIREVEELGLTVRGVYGEGTKAEGFTYQISNEVTLGVTEEQILEEVTKTVERICTAEREEAERIYGGREIETMDRARKSFGVLTNAVVLSYQEFLEHISRVKIGAMMGVINIVDIDKLDDLTVSVRPHSLSERYGKPLSAIDRDLFRAEIVGSTLIKLKE